MPFEQIPGSQGYINNLAGADLSQHYRFGLGKAGKNARADMAAFRSGEDVSNIPGFKYVLAQIKASAAAQATARNRQIGANTAFSGQPGLMAGIEAEQGRTADQDTQRNIVGGVENAYNTSAQQYQQALQQQNQTATSYNDLYEKQLADAANLNNQAYQRKAPGFFSKLGDAVAGGVGTAIGGSTSFIPHPPCDQRVKDNIEDFDNGLEVINALQIKEFDYNERSGAFDPSLIGQHAIGVIAQEAQKIDPLLVNDGYLLTINPNHLIFLLVNAVKDLSQQVGELQVTKESKYVDA